jgi:hypothetical protein
MMGTTTTKQCNHEPHILTFAIAIKIRITPLYFPRYSLPSISNCSHFYLLILPFLKHSPAIMTSYKDLVRAVDDLMDN